jgi:aminoglycoside phosphotransferase (APT) family kinase protein
MLASYSPSLSTLQAGIRLAGKENGVDVNGLSVIRRRPNPHISTFPSEIVTCRLTNGQHIDLFCKYWVDRANEAHGHRGGAGYEADVYRFVLKGLQLPIPLLFGVHQPDDARATWLVLHYLADSMKVSKIPASVDPDAMRRAVEWIAEFHAHFEKSVSDSNLSFMTRYDVDYYQGWATRTAALAASKLWKAQWIQRLCGQFDQVVDVLVGACQTVLHGEYFSKNILYSNKSVYPVDWESCAIGVGEIDLVALIDGWPEPIGRRLKDAYKEARWPAGAPDNSDSIFHAAEIYHQMRWMTNNQASWRCRVLNRAAKQLGIL